MGVKRMQRAKLAAAYLLLALAAALGWLYSCLPDRVYLEPGQALYLPRFAWVEPQRGHGSRNVASTRAVGSYQTTLTLGGWLPIKTIRAVVTERPRVTVCGTPFGVKMFSEGALIVGFSEIGQADGGTSNPAKEAGLRLGDRVICIGQTRTESNDAVKEALDAAEGQSVEVVYIRSGEQKLTTLTPVWDGAAGQWRAGMWVRDSSAGVGTLTFADEELGVFAGLGHPISDSDTGETVVLLSRETNPLTVEVRMEVETGEVKEHPTYKRIQEYVQEKYGFKVHTAYIAEVKRMVGLDMHKAPNAVEQRKHEYHPCPHEKVEAIKDALRHFGLIAE